MKLSDCILTECKTFFSLIGDFDSADITNKLGLVPDIAWNVNDPATSLVQLGSLNGIAKQPFSRWVCGTCCDYSGEIVEQLKITLKNLFDKADVIRSIVEETKCKAYLNIVCDAYPLDITPNFSLDYEIIEFCYKSKTVIDSDLFIKPTPRNVKKSDEENIFELVSEVFRK